MKSKRTLQNECDRVNETLKAEAVRLRLGTKFGRARLDDNRSDLQAFSFWAEREFCEFVRRTLERHGGSMNGRALVVDGARMLAVSTETTKRYLAKLRAAGGPFAGLGDVVMLNGRYVPAEEDGYWEDDDSTLDPTPRPLPKRKNTLGEGGIE